MLDLLGSLVVMLWQGLNLVKELPGSRMPEKKMRYTTGESSCPGLEWERFLQERVNEEFLRKGVH